jgi:hypothetical protein
MSDVNDPLATSTDIFKFETAAELQHPTMIAICGENTVPYELDDAIKVLVQHKGVAPMTRAQFTIEDVEPLCVRDAANYQETLDRLLVANLQIGGENAWRVRGLLTAKANPNANAMQMAISRGNVGAFYALMQAGASPGRTMMRCAVKSGSAEMVRSVGMLNLPEETDLVDVAARCGFVDVLGVLVNELGYTLHQTLMLHPVYRAIEKGQCDVVDFFFKNDATLATKRYRDGRNALTVAAAAGQAAVIEMLVKKYGMDPYDMDVLCAAARHDRPAALRKLGVLLNTRRHWMEECDREGEKPMMAAMRNGGYVAMITLAEMGADPFDVLFEMARANKSAGLDEMLSVLIDKQERMQEIVDARRETHTLLSWAAIHGSFDCALMVMRRVEALKKMMV